MPVDLLPFALQHYQDKKLTGGFPLPINKTFVMGPKDVVLSLIRTPPPVKYYSVRSYMTYRYVHAHMSSKEALSPANVFDWNDVIVVLWGCFYNFRQI